jgi:hypothetical protein
VTGKLLSKMDVPQRGTEMGAVVAYVTALVNQKVPVLRLPKALTGG